jgi:hypothetical protein
MGGILSVTGHLLERVADQWGGRVPHLTALVVAKEGRPDAGLPSPRMREFWPSYSDLTREEKERKALAEWTRIASFGSRWNDILRALELPEVSDVQDFLVEDRPISPVGDHLTGSLAEPKATILTRPFSCWQVCVL